MKNIRTICSIALYISFSGLTPLSAQVKITVNAAESRQTIIGFGGSMAYYENWLVAHTKRSQIYDYLFKDLGISILRLRNSYMNEGGTNTAIDDAKKIVVEANKRGPIDVLLTSWSPAGKYKSNGKPQNEETRATLARDSSGNFVYDGFANWWYQSLLQYKSRGIIPKYISIQNEPNFNPSWEGCILMPEEQLVTDTKLDSTYMVASYPIAFSRVYAHLDSNRASLGAMPLMVGPEVIGIEKAWSGKPSDYTSRMDMSQCYGVSHHLYTGGSSGDPLSYISNLSAMYTAFPKVPRMQTEFSDGDWYSTALLMHYALLYEQVNVYLVWELFWPGSDFLSIENPWTPGSWTTPNGYTVGQEYYAFKQYTAFIKPGWRRVDAVSSSTNVKTTAYISPDGSRMSIILINTSAASQNVMADPLYYEADSGRIYTTSATSKCEIVGAYTPGIITIPAKSITTLSLYGNYDLRRYTLLLKFPLSNQYLIANDTTGAIQNNGGGTMNSAYQQFTLLEEGDSLVVLQNRGTEKFLRPQADSSLPVLATADSAADAEKFIIFYNPDGTISFKSVLTGKYLHVEGAPAYTPPQFITISGDTIGEAEKFSCKVISPVIRISSPVPDTTFQDSLVQFEINSDARDVDGQMSKVEYFLGGTKIGESSVSPYTISWEADSSGSYTFTAIATDNSGISTTSEPLTIRVNIVFTGIKGNLSGELVSVFPNPVNNGSVLTITGLQPGAEISLVSVNGRIVHKQIAANPVCKVDVSNVVPGTYLLTVKNAGAEQSFRIIKQ
jgi:glucuronoarabinoxylan endo-1,4-beta-xylanase